MQRIMIIGGSGAGKSTLAVAVGRKLDLPVIHINPMYFRPGWVQRPSDETTDLVREAADKQRWVFEGNNSKNMDYRAARADLIVFLDVPRRIRMAGVLRRTMASYGKVRPDMAPGCREQIDWAFLRWVWNYDRDHRPRGADLSGPLAGPGAGPASENPGRTGGVPERPHTIGIGLTPA